MQTKLKGKHFITTQEWTTDELETVFALARELKLAKATGKPMRLLEDKTLYMIFFDSSTRTRNSFETGITQLGGHGIFLSPTRCRSATERTPRTRPRCCRGTATPSPSATVRSARQPVPARGRALGIGAGAQHAVRRLPPVPDPG